MLDSLVPAGGCIEALGGRAITSRGNTTNLDTTPVMPSVYSPPLEQLPLLSPERGVCGELAEGMTDLSTSVTSSQLRIKPVSDSYIHTSRTIIDEDEEQLMMRDSPKWEDEEIQADESEQPRAIKAEIKLLVKTTELGKESIEIRSIREFVDIEEKQHGAFGSILSSSPERVEIEQTGDRIFTLHRKTSPGRTPSPRFVRPIDSEDSTFLSGDPSDEFNLMSQVRGKPNLACLSFFIRVV